METVFAATVWYLILSIDGQIEIVETPNAAACEKLAQAAEELALRTAPEGGIDQITTVCMAAP